MTDVLRQELARAALDVLEDRRGLRGPLLAIRSEDPEIYADIATDIADRLADVLARYEHPVTR